MASNKLIVRAPQPATAVVVALLLALCLATVADARPLKPSSDGDDDALAAAVEAPAGDIETVVGTTTMATAEHGGEGCGGHRFMSIDMLGGVKDSGPSPGAGH